MALMTNYQLAKLVNFRLEQEGLPTVRSQQIYNVLKNKPEFDTEDPATVDWIESYVETRRTGKSTRGSVDPAKWFAEQDAKAQLAAAAEASKAIEAAAPKELGPGAE